MNAKHFWIWRRTSRSLARIVLLLATLAICLPQAIGHTNFWQCWHPYKKAFDTNAPCLTDDCCPAGSEGTASGSGGPGTGSGFAACIPCLQQKQWEESQRKAKAAREQERQDAFVQYLRNPNMANRSRLRLLGGPPALLTGSGSVANQDGHFGSPGMPVWLVTEPEVNLWLLDTPLSYQPSRGPAMSLMLRYKDQDGAMGEFATSDGTTFNLLDTNLFSLGWRWSFNWRTWLETESQGSDSVRVHTSDGRTLAYTLDQIEYNTLTTLTLDSTNNRYVLTYPNGAKDYYGIVASSGTNYGGVVQGTNQGGTTVYRYFLGKRDDPHGNGLKFRYLTNTPVKLDYMLDADNRATRFTYATGNTNFAALIWKITDPETNVVEFKYAANGCLTNITDVAGIASWLVYDAEKNVSSLITPYGTTAFNFPVGQLTRAIRVTEPNDGQHLWLTAKDYDEDLVPPKYADVPCTTNGNYFSLPHTFNNGLLDGYNSFYWGPLQYPLLNATVRSMLVTNYSGFTAELTAADFNAGRQRHWLNTESGDFSLTLSLEREPSPDGTGEGAKTWYDYEEKSGEYYEIEGTMRWPRCVAVRLPNGANGESRFTWFVRNSLGNPEQAIDSYTDSGIWKTRTNWFKYSADGIDLITHTNALGKLVSSNLYDPTLRLVRTNWDVLGQMTVYTYNAKGQVTNLSRPSGLNTAYLYFTNGTYADWLDRIFDYEVVSQTNRYHRTNAFTYLRGLLYTYKDPRDLLVTNFWDALGRPTGQWFPDGSTTTNKYHLLSISPYPNSTGSTNLLDLTQTRDRNGLPTSFTYDAARFLITITDAYTNVTHYDRCDCGVLESVTTAMTNVITYDYDNAGVLTKTVYPTGQSITNTYDAIGRLVKVSDAHGYLVYGYNNQGLVTVVSNAVGQIASLAYDRLDRVSSQTDANGVTTSFSYDDASRLATRLVSGTGTESFAYNARGLTNYTDPLTNKTWYVYDALGRLTAQTNANAEVLQFAYQPAGDLASLIDGRGNATTWQYDVYGRVTGKSDARTTNILAYTYDPGGRLTNRWSLGKGNSRYEYDLLNNLTKVTYEANTNGLGTNVLTFAYDKDRRLTSGFGRSAGCRDRTALTSSV